MKIINALLLFISLTTLNSCSDYLDVVPDNIPTIDHAFNNRVNAEKYLFTCYSYLPNPVDPNANEALLGGYESWIAPEGWWYFDNSNNLYAWKLARDGQNSNDPLLNSWDGGNGAGNLFIAIRDCNIFLENIDKPVDLEEYEKVRWVSEVKFLKAYYHFYLLRKYGPIPIVDENLPVSSTPEEVRVYREPVDDVVKYIADLLNDCLEDLPDDIQNQTQEMGRITKSAALALKAKALTLCASPIFNGNPFYTNIKDNKGRNLFSTSYDPAKWTVAAEAIKKAIDFAESHGAGLYYYQGFDPISDSTRIKLNVRGAVTERWNKEILWGSTKNDNFLQQVAAVRLQNAPASAPVISMMSPTIQVAERFYSNHGVPIEEDKTWDYANRYKTGIVSQEERYYLKEGYETANLHMKREPRFYASLSFDGCIIYGNGVVGDQDYSKLNYAQMKKGQTGGMTAAEKYSASGYLPKKLVGVESVINGSNWTSKRYSFPVIRLADLYLMYAEALNESKSAPDDDVYFWIDEVRKRAGLEGVKESWTKYSTNSSKVNTKEGMREIIHRERLIELAFEGEPYWDLLRWKEAESEFKKPITGWNVKGDNMTEYYEVKVLIQPQFNIKNYLFPIKQNSLDVNPNLVQNFGWGTSN